MRKRRGRCRVPRRQLADHSMAPLHSSLSGSLVHLESPLCLEEEGEERSMQWTDLTCRLGGMDPLIPSTFFPTSFSSFTSSATPPAHEKATSFDWHDGQVAVEEEQGAGVGGRGGRKGGCVDHGGTSGDAR